MANFGFFELLILLAALIFVFIIPFVFIYKYGKQKGRLRELERQIQELRKLQQ
jgi:predicted membrane metal-binding protein